MLTELEAQTRKTAHARFVAAVWEGQGSHDLLALAGAAGLDGSQADVMFRRIDKARGQLSQAHLLSKLRRKAAALDRKRHKIQVQAEAEIARLEALVDDATFAASDARKAVIESEGCVQQLLALHDEGLLLVDVPPDVLRLVARRDAEQKASAAHQAMNVARDECLRCRAAAEDAERRLVNMPILPPLEQERERHRLRDRLADARAVLAKAESKWNKAVAASEAAKKAIPTADSL